MNALSNSLVSTKHSSPAAGSALKSVNQCVGSLSPKNLSFSRIQTRKQQICTSKRTFTIQAGYSDGGKPGGAGLFVGGFLLGGIVVGTLSCVYAPQISKALAGTDKKELMSKLPKFIYDEERALERTRKVLEHKIAQLNSAIDDVSAQLSSEDDSDRVAVVAGEVEAAT
ncbi:uncharacterized protein LOC127798692 [Diospyros lotus]|uniref:uncharacterized protein LOC127798692 n=1 Tax=Diospyros lotus TaxID=55363 RepID=UPI002253CBAC|nr:uncharacterized protein LOC127798692 [Diospyros lotus]